MPHHPRIESSRLASLITTRSRNSELWFIKNKRLEEAILGYAAKFAKRYDVKLYAFAIEGNHIHTPSHFPKCNRASFMRDFNSCVARAVKRFTPEYKGGTFWARRYSSEFLPDDSDIEKYFFYTVLQPVQDGLVEKISEYPGYNCFYDAIYGIKRKFKVIRWKEYNDAKRYNEKVSIDDYTDIVALEYARLPGYEELSQKEYASLMLKKLDKYQTDIAKQRAKDKLKPLGRAKLLKIKRGSVPKSTKTSTRNSFRPRILTSCPQSKAFWTDWYFCKFFAYKAASEEYRNGNINVVFPEGMFKPIIPPKGQAP